MRELVQEWQTADEAGTELVAAELFAVFASADCVIFNGGLGAGKTTLIRYFCGHYQVGRVTSPTFTIVNIYNSKPVIYHFDFYRLLSSDELFEIGFYEYIEDREAITLIEWGGMFPEVLPERRYEIEIEQGEENNRNIKLYRIKPDNE
ncbi:MAG: tRNA (adenosine(37)-N6)-threonylcarbamoyltransferase complex ATPase subunit type 1 TsaE [Ignavibacteriales bacterium]|nr:tRNA (adenosine(37)-N6)-threonylcarbamoyltransferase complex ATPase subunit type 1 TsaE [Ignavibacteriales bacterium]